MSTDEKQRGTRDRILLAAMTLIGENPGARVSVRAVAERAGVSTGSLRHHFPTQRLLQDEVLRRLYDVIVPDDVIQDRSMSPHARLVACLRQILAPEGVGERDVREAMRAVYEQFILPEPSEEMREAYLPMEREARRRTASWLAVLAQEGAVREGDGAAQVDFLLAVVNGLSLTRALPSSESTLESETATLALAVDAVLRSP